MQSRAIIKKAVVAEYAERMKKDDQFPPLAVFSVDGSYILLTRTEKFTSS